MEKFYATTRSGMKLECSFISEPQKWNLDSEATGNIVEITVNGTSFRGRTVKVQGKPAVNFDLTPEVKKALNANVPAKNATVFSDDYTSIWKNMIAEKKKELIEKANSIEFTKVRFTYHTTHKFGGFSVDAECECIDFNDLIKDFQNTLQVTDKKELEQYKTDTHYDDYSIEYVFEMTVDEVKNFIQSKTNAVEEKEEADKADEEKSTNISNGAIYFTTESKPHNETDVVFNSPAPQQGSFVLEHRISKDLFNRIKDFGTYYDADMIEDFDLFGREPGWRFYAKAISELTKTHRVFVDNKEIK